MDRNVGVSEIVNKLLLFLLAVMVMDFVYFILKVVSSFLKQVAI